MHYPSAPTVYRSSPAAPGRNYGNMNKGTDCAGKGVQANGVPQSLQFIHQVPSEDTTYYCKELNGNWQIRSTNDIMNNCQPGDWRNHSTTGYPFFVRKAAK